MCGICGIARQDKREPDSETLSRMNAAIAHRGPDGDGFYCRPGIGLAVRRLAIIDVAGGDQPISNEDNSLWIVYNGESFNFLELHEQLKKRGHTFRTKTDTECVLHLYEDYGDDCMQHLRGQFAFALWDEKKQRLLIARDRMGQKPLYYTVQDGVLYFGSELSSLYAALPHRPEISLQAIDLYLSLQYIPEPLTIYEGIHKLPAAHRMVWQDGDLQIDSYWKIDYQPKHTASEDDLTEELRHLARQAVEMRLMSEVPLGAHLSGGIDSSIVVALMSQASAGPVKTFSVGFEETSFSEIPYARSVAERYSTDHHEFTLTFDDIPATLEKLLVHFGEPFADPSALPLYHLSRLTREHVTVALNGDGGDEAFAGYQRYWLDPWANRYLKLPALFTHSLVPAIAGGLPEPANAPVGSSFVSGLKRLGQVANVDARASLLRWGSYFAHEHKSALWQPEFHQMLDLQRSEEFLVDHFDSAPARSFLDRTLYTDVKTYLAGDLLVKADRMTMAHSVEGRSPFLDHELAGWAARLPEEMKVRGRTGKYLLRKAFADDLPPEISGRGKQGFGIPVGAWFRGPLASWSKDLILNPQSKLSAWFQPAALNGFIEEHQTGRNNHGKKLYALAMLAIWAKQAA